MSKNKQQTYMCDDIFRDIQEKAMAIILENEQLKIKIKELTKKEEELIKVKAELIKVKEELSKFNIEQTIVLEEKKELIQEQIEKSNPEIFYFKSGAEKFIRLLNLGQICKEMKIKKYLFEVEWYSDFVDDVIVYSPSDSLLFE